MPKGIPKSGKKPGNPNIVEAGKKTQFNSKTAAENGKKGQSATQMIKSVREYLEDNLAKKNSKGETYKENMTKAVLNKALSGDPQCIQLVLKIIGEAPADKVSVSVSKTDSAALDALESVVLNDTRTSDKPSS